MALPSLLSAAQQASYKEAISSVFWTFSRPFQVFIQAQTAHISTDPNWSRFGQHDQNVFSPEVNPQVYTITGCILYGNKQPYQYIAPYPGSDAQQLKLRESNGTVRIKVETDGYALLSQCQQVVLDGFQFNMTSTPRPHGIVGQPDRWTFDLDKID